MDDFEKFCEDRRYTDDHSLLLAYYETVCKLDEVSGELELTRQTRDTALSRLDEQQKNWERDLLAARKEFDRAGEAEVAGLRREINELTNRTKARKCAATLPADPPMDCNAPFCGCNPAWGDCIELLQESGWGELHPLQSRLDTAANLAVQMAKERKELEARLNTLTTYLSDHHGLDEEDVQAMYASASA